MQIKLTTPPLWEQISEKFNLTPEQPIWYTHGDCIYSPSGVTPPLDIIIHEMVHAEQQEHHDDVANIWWKRCLHDPDFQIAQEAEAYGAQYRFLCERYKDRNVRDKWLRGLAEVLSGPTYGNRVNYTDARQLIKEFAEHGRPKLTQMLDTTNQEEV